MSENVLARWVADGCVEAAGRLLAYEAENETVVADRIKRVLDAAKCNFVSESDRSDLVLPGARVVIEVKREGRARNPEDPGTGSRAGESAFEQLYRYVEQRRTEHAQQRGVSDDPGVWRGVVSDGRCWHMWEWGPTSFAEPRDRDSVVYTKGQGFDLAVWLGRVCEHYDGLASVPDGFHDKLFSTHLERLHELRSEILGSNDDGAKTVLDTQYRLWQDMLTGADMRPPSGRALDLFVAHTFLVVVARSVAQLLSDDPSARNPDVVRSLVDEGFVSWVLETPQGEQWASGLFDTASRFDWRESRRDVFREMYETVIDKDLRRYFGEYYTPDWLAQMVVEEVLDDEWCERSINKVIAARDPVDGVGVLDPACGSGTFLYHAAQRILDHPLVNNSDVSDVEKADVVARLVNGIDIHPIAVEIARATLLRAMPSVPSSGLRSLRVWQGDALGEEGDTQNQQTSVFTQKDDTKLTFQSPGGGVVVLPVEFLGKGPVQYNLTVLVNAAKEVPGNPGATLPGWMLSNLSEGAAEQVKAAFASLATIIQTEGDGVWAWFMSNQAGPHLLSLTKVDRIVANPPWVIMSKVQEPERKNSLENLIDREDLYSSGSVGNRGAFDIAALFLRLCPARYFAGEMNEHRIGKTGWVLNAGSLKGGNWEQYNASRLPTRTVDMSGVKQPPFDGASACVHYFGEDVTTSACTMFTDETTGNISRSDPWQAVKPKVKQEAAPMIPQASPSGYVTNGSCEFRAGARLNPTNFVICDTVSSDNDTATFKSLLTSRAKRPYKRYGALEGSVPSRWLHETVLADNLYPFAVDDQLPLCIIPTDEVGNILSESEEGNSDYWKKVSNYYHRHRGRGRGTPPTLLKYLNMHNNLATLHSRLQQMRDDKNLAVVYYNASGQHIRAARSTAPQLCSDQLYYAVVSFDEAGYLVSIINSAILAERFRSTRKSDRHFHTYPWKDIPIPKFDSTQQEHMELAELCTAAESVSQSVSQSVSLI